MRRSISWHAIFEFGERLKGGGVGLLYYSGHGMRVKGENYLIPIDANIVREDDIKRKTISARDILVREERLVQSCFSPPVAPQRLVALIAP